jgi:hypothetical protein
VSFETDDDLSIGEFGIATRMVQVAGAAGARKPKPRRRPRRVGRDDGLQAAHTSRCRGAAPEESPSAQEIVT